MSPGAGANGGQRLLDQAGTARYLGTTERHVRVLWERRELPGIKVGRLVRFDIRDIAAYIAARRVEAVRGPVAGGER